MGLSREELKLRSAQRRAHRIGDPNIIQSTLFGMLVVDEFCTWDPHYKRVEVFGSQKRKPDTPIRVDKETYRPDTINFSQPHLVKRITKAPTTTLPTIVEEVETCVEQVQPLPLAEIDVCGITIV